VLEGLWKAAWLFFAIFRQFTASDWASPANSPAIQRLASHVVYRESKLLRNEEEAMKRCLLSLVVVGLVAAFAGRSVAADKDIVDTAVAAGKFKTLAAALQAAGLVETLKGKGPFTVFAPTDDAFAKLPKGTVETLLKPENKEKLVAILTYHVVPGKVKAADVVKLKSAKTVSGKSVMIDASKGVRVNKSNVVATDIETSNGVIHIIDAVLLPPSK
jgi:uncharacterized surface protein with fasciclin (FAS1) repeats